ncbi:hypothetical protein CHUAL_001145 [Chamberlinius hualienensis]
MAIGYKLAFVLAVCRLFACPVVAFSPTPVVQIQQGSIQGEILTSTTSERPFFSFRGIPYGQPPKGDLRFKAPEAALPWTGILNVSTDGSACVQYISFAVPPFQGLVMGDEDCLYINVYSPMLPQSNDSVNLLPVLVFIHGGGFGEGSNSFSMYGPHRFMDKNMLVVIPNYRLGPLGFLSTADAASSGNYGLLDQNLALQWIQNNIAAFGGDPKRVTLSGQSAGSASVLYHLLSPVSAGLFHQGILESGSVIAPWAMQLDPKLWAFQLGSAVNCQTNDSFALVDCLRNKPAFELAKIAGSFNNGSWMALTFIPVVEDLLWGKFLTESPMKLLQSGNFTKVPVLSGVVQDEGTASYGSTASYFDSIDDHFFDVIIPNLLDTFTHFQNNLVNLSYAIKDEYYTNINIEDDVEVIIASEQMYSDLFATSENDMTIRLLTNQSVPVYMYVFDFPDCFHTNFSGQPEVPHTAELYYLYNTSFIILNDKCLDVSRNIVDLWSNFVIQGNPNPINGTDVWINTPTNEIHYLEITEDLVMKDGYLTQRVWFWNEYLPTIGGSQYF